MSLIILQPSKRKTVRKTDVFLEGELTVGNIKQLSKEVLEVFERFDIVTFYLKNVQQLDLSCIQLLHYINESFKDKGKKITVSCQLSDDLNALIRNSGYAGWLLN